MCSCRCFFWLSFPVQFHPRKWKIRIGSWGKIRISIMLKHQQGQLGTLTSQRRSGPHVFFKIMNAWQQMPTCRHCMIWGFPSCLITIDVYFNFIIIIYPSHPRPWRTEILPTLHPELKEASPGLSSVSELSVSQYLVSISTTIRGFTTFPTT